jgi:hypothetical protein
MYECDPRTNGIRRSATAKGNFHAFNHQRALIGMLSSGKNAHERAFARAILSNHGKNFSRPDLEINIVQRLHSGKALRNSPGF